METTISGLRLFLGHPSIYDIWEFPKIMGTLLGGPHSKDHNILGSILESPYFGKLPYPCYVNLMPSSLAASQSFGRKSLQNDTLLCGVSASWKGMGNQGSSVYLGVMSKMAIPAVWYNLN